MLMSTAADFGEKTSTGATGRIWIESPARKSPVPAEGEKVKTMLVGPRENPPALAAVESGTALKPEATVPVVYPGREAISPESLRVAKENVTVVPAGRLSARPEVTAIEASIEAGSEHFPPARVISRRVLFDTVAVAEQYSNPLSNIIAAEELEKMACDAVREILFLP